MTADDIIAHYGSITAAAESLGVTVPAVRKWRRQGVPIDRQIDAVEDSRGRLQPDEAARALLGRYADIYRQLFEGSPTCSQTTDGAG